LGFWDFGIFIIWHIWVNCSSFFVFLVADFFFCLLE
jgi:hypothetical protein